MSPVETLPRAAEPFVTFATLLRQNGFAVAPEQTMSFIEAVGLLGPANMADIHRAAHAILAPPPERRREFDALFRMHFLGQSLPVSAPGEGDEEDMLVGEEGPGDGEPPEPEEESEAGGEAIGAEMLGARRFTETGEAAALRRFRRQAPTAMPMRRSWRRARSHRGGAFDMRKAMRQAVARDGEVIELPRLKRKPHQRRMVLLIDISGSMKQHTDQYLRFAHALARSAERIEVFTLGTRLTRITRALKLRNPTQALALAADIVADWDGGTRLGDALTALLAIPRFAGFARGAAVIVLSDGLERGDHAAMTAAVARLSRLAWRLVWLTPLATAADFRPETAAMQAVLPYLDALRAGSSVAAICDEVLALAREAA